jgi:uncharacterized membrane protein
MLVEILQKMFFYGCIGILIEFFFTSIHSLIIKNWKATGYSYLWMLPVYGGTALFLEAISISVMWPFYLKALLYVPVIYGIEALAGWTLQKVIGVIPWDYKKSAWTPMGLINLKYAPFWLALAMAFEPISVYLGKIVHFISTVN